MKGNVVYAALSLWYSLSTFSICGQETITWLGFGSRRVHKGELTRSQYTNTTEVEVNLQPNTCWNFVKVASIFVCQYKLELLP